MRRHLWASCLLLSLGLGISAQDREMPEGAWGLSLEEALRIALEQNLQLQASELSIPRAVLGQDSAEAPFDPVVSGGINYAVNRAPFFSTNPFSGLTAGELSVSQSENLFFTGSLEKTWTSGGTTGVSYNLTRTKTENQFSLNPSYTPSIALTGRQPLLKNAWFDRNTEGIQLAEKQVTSAQLGYESQAIDTAATVESEYYELVFAYENILVQRKVLDVAESSHVRTVSFIAAGLQAPADSIDSSSFVAEARARLQIAELALLNARDSLLSLLHAKPELADWNVQIWPMDRAVDIPALPELDEDRALSIALENRPDYRSAEVDIQSREISLRARDNELLPQLDLTASWTWFGLGNTRYNSHDALFDGRFYEIAVGLELTYPIFNREAESNYQIAEIDLDIAKRNLHALRQTIIFEVRTGLRALRSARAALDESVAARRRAEAELDLRRTRVEAQFDTPFEVRQAEEAFVQAEAAVLRAKIDMYKAQTELERRMGTLLDSHGIRLSYPEGLPAPQP